MNVSKLINLALKQLGVIAAGENANANEVADAVDSLRGLLAQWATERLLVYKVEPIELVLNGKGAYTLNQTIQDISETAELDGVEIQIIRDLNQTVSNTHVIYTEKTPFWTFNVLTDAKLLKLKACVLPTALNAQDELNLPEKYERALILSLTLEIASMFGTEPSALVYKNQANAIDLLKRSNSTPYYSQASDLPVGVRRGCY